MDKLPVLRDKYLILLDRCFILLGKVCINYYKISIKKFFTNIQRCENLNKKMKVLSSLLLLVIVSCSSTHTLYIVRHAEKLDNTPYSVLSPQGHQRAAVLKDSLLPKKIDLVFATQFQRAQETAQPLATALNKPLLIYRNNAIDSIVTVLKQHTSKNILLVAHSGNIPSIIKGLTGKDVNPIDENQYDNFYIIKTNHRNVELIQKKY